MVAQNREIKKYLEKTGEIGTVTYCKDPIAHVSGLPSLKAGEAVFTEKGEKGMVYQLDEKKAEVLIFQGDRIEAGQKVVGTGEPFSIPASEGLLGRVINPLCKSLDEKGPIGGNRVQKSIKSEAPGITKRSMIKDPVETGVTAVDLLVPVGHGQREMVVGDAKTGKTTLLLQAISNQARKGSICVYVGIGKESSAFKEVESYLQDMDVFEKVVMMITTSSDPATLHYIAPSAGMTVAEYFRDLGNRVIIVFDDLSNHAKAYREISLLLKKPPAREAYPGDIFHVHAELVERAGNIVLDDGTEASITALPVAETLENDLSGFIQTNLLGMTDGHIFFDIDELRKGRYPAISTSLSVSRAGNQTKKDLDKHLADKIRKKLAEYRKVEEVAQFGAELSKENRQVLDLGAKIEILLNQGPKTLIPRELQLVLFGLLLTGFWKDVSGKVMAEEVEKLVAKFADDDLTELENRLEGMKNTEQLKDYCYDIGPKLEKFL